MSQQNFLISASLMIAAALAGTPTYATVISIDSSGQIEVQDTPNYLQKKKITETENSGSVQKTSSRLKDSDLLIPPTSSENTQVGGTLSSEPVVARVISSPQQDAEQDFISELNTTDINQTVETISTQQKVETPTPSLHLDTLSTNQKSSALFGAFVELEAAKHEAIETSLIEAVIEAESNYDPLAVSPKGAMGLMQLMPATAIRHGVVDAFNPKDNIRAGTAELARLMEVYEDNMALALAGYNAGENAVKKYDGIPPYDETQNYVVKVLSKVLSKQAALLKTKNLEQSGSAKPNPRHEIRRMKVYTYTFQP